MAAYERDGRKAAKERNARKAGRRGAVFANEREKGMRWPCANDRRREEKRTACARSATGISLQSEDNSDRPYLRVLTSWPELSARGSSASLPVFSPRGISRGGVPGFNFTL